MHKSLPARFLASTSGNVALMAALAAIPLLGVGGVALDTYRLGEAQARLQASIDAAALAGASSGAIKRRDIRKVIHNFAKANGAGDIIGKPSDIKITFLNDGTIVVRAEGKMSTTLTSLLGHKSMDVVAETAVKPLSGGVEVALVLDTTDSMNAEGRIGALRDAAHQFIETIDPSSSKIALVPYAHYVNVGTANQNANWLGQVNLGPGQQWFGCVGSREHPLNKMDVGYGNKLPPIISGPGAGNVYSQGKCAPEILPLTNDFAKLKSHIKSLTATGWTYIPAGLMWGWRSLSAVAPFTEGEGPTNAAAKNIHKFIVLMTDGLNTMEKKPGTPYLGHNQFKTETTDKLMLDICENIKGAGIEIYTIGFKLQVPAMKAKLQSCSSSPENYYDAGSDAQLAAAYQSIASKVSAIYMSR